jgi:hypothetical protein
MRDPKIAVILHDVKDPCAKRIGRVPILEQPATGESRSD